MISSNLVSLRAVGQFRNRATTWLRTSSIVVSCGCPEYRESRAEHWSWRWLPVPFDSLSNYGRAACPRPLSLQIMPNGLWRAVRGLGRDGASWLCLDQRGSCAFPIVAIRDQDILRKMWNASDLPARREPGDDRYHDRNAWPARKISTGTWGLGRTQNRLGAAESESSTFCEG